MNEQAVRAAFAEQAGYCERLGSPLTARVLRAAEAVLDRSTATGRRVLDWRGDPRASADSVPLRLAGALHALARSGVAAELAAAYAEGSVEPELIGRILAEHDAMLLPWLDLPPQTNETGRSAAIRGSLRRWNALAQGRMCNGRSLGCAMSWRAKARSQRSTSPAGRAGPRGGWPPATRM